MRLFLGLLVATLLCGCASVEPGAPVALSEGQTLVSFAGDNGITLTGQLKIPAARFGVNPIKKSAAIVFQHGCGGPGLNGKLSARHQAAMDWAVARGIIALHVDSLTARGEKELCTQKFSARNITQKHRVADAYAGLRYLATHPQVDANRIAIWGWSHGGSSVLGVMNETVAAAVAEKETLRFATAISFYPGCSAFANSRRPYRVSNPTLILIGEADDWTPAAPCKALHAAPSNENQALSLALYPDAYHGFDDPNPNAKVRVRADVPNGVNPGRGVTVGPNPQARARAMKAVEAFLITQNIVSIPVR